MDNKWVAVELTKLVSDNIIQETDKYSQEQEVVNTYTRILERLENYEEEKK